MKLSLENVKEVHLVAVVSAFSLLFFRRMIWISPVPHLWRGYLDITRPTTPPRDSLGRLMFSNNFLSEGMGDLAANMSSFTTALKQVHDLVALLV